MTKLQTLLNKKGTKQNYNSKSLNGKEKQTRNKVCFISQHTESTMTKNKTFTAQPLLAIQTFRRTLQQPKKRKKSNSHSETESWTCSWLPHLGCSEVGDGIEWRSHSAREWRVELGVTVLSALGKLLFNTLAQTRQKILYKLKASLSSGISPKDFNIPEY